MNPFPSLFKAFVANFKINIRFVISIDGEQKIDI